MSHYYTGGIMNQPLQPLRERSLEQIILDVLQAGGGVMIRRTWHATQRTIDVHVFDEHRKEYCYRIPIIEWNAMRLENRGAALQFHTNQCERQVFG